MYTLVIRTLPHHPIPTPIRLRRLLKIILRSLAFRCVRITEAPAVGPNPQDMPACEPEAAAGVVAREVVGEVRRDDG
jgi:hypothetical protein